MFVFTAIPVPVPVPVPMSLSTSVPVPVPAADSVGRLFVLTMPIVALLRRSITMLAVAV